MANTPASWRDEAFRVTQLARVWVAALALGLLTEGLQFFASHRDPSVADVAIDLAGTALGLGLAWAAVRLSDARCLGR